MEEQWEHKEQLRVSRDDRRNPRYHLQEYQRILTGSRRILENFLFKPQATRNEKKKNRNEAKMFEIFSKNQKP